MQKAFEIGDDGWCVAGVIKTPSPHFDARPSDMDDLQIDTVVLHNISLPPLTFGSGVVREFFCATLNWEQHDELKQLEGLRVSSHFFIDRHGQVEQFVSCLDRAWHAGISRFNGKTRCNDFSIGIELEGTDFVPFEQAQYEALVGLLEGIDTRFPLKYIVGHSDIAPERKTDPGPYFDWIKLYRERDKFGAPCFAGAAAQKQFSIVNPHRWFV